MPRKARKVHPNVPAHITQRGNNKHVVFQEDMDKSVFLKYLSKYCNEFKTDIHSYCLMDNHYHLACTPESTDTLAKMFGRLNWRYSMYFNRKYGRSGHLWQERFNSFHMTGMHFLRAMRYIEMNPVTAGLVTSPLDWPWSSAQISCGNHAAPSWFRAPKWWDSYFTHEKWYQYLLQI